MKNSNKALLFAWYWYSHKQSYYAIKMEEFAKENSLTMGELYDAVMNGYPIAEKIYLDYVNNYLTVEKFANYYGYTEHEANMVIDIVRGFREEILKK